MTERFEIVCTARTSDIAEALALLLHAGATPASYVVTLLSEAEGAQFLSPGGAGSPLSPPRLPALYDNLRSVDVTLPLAALRYAARAGGSYLLQRGAGGEPSTLASDEARGDAVAEVACGWLSAPSDTPSEGARRMGLLQGLLARYTRVPQDEGASVSQTYGDLLAWLCLDTEVGKWGAAEALKGCSPTMEALLSATARRAGVADFIRARAERRGGGSSGGGGSGEDGGNIGCGGGGGAPPPPQPSAPASAIAVTGAGGFVASWIVKTLLELGKTVHGTVRTLKDPRSWGHLLDFPGAGGSDGLQEALERSSKVGYSVLVSGNLRLYPADLLGEVGPFLAALGGCHTLIHTASPYDVAAPKEDQFSPASPALKGTDTVLHAAEASPDLRRIVLTSSAAAVYVGAKPADHVYSEADWSDAGLLEKAGSWYALGKLRAERAAWDFVLSQRHVAARAALVRSGGGPCPPLTMAAICPTQCLGPLFEPRLNQSSAFLAAYANGTARSLPAKGKCLVDVRDVAMAHVLACAGGAGRPRLSIDGSGRQTHPERYLLVAGSMPWRAIGEVIRAALPRGAPVPTEVDPGPPSLPQALCSQAASYRLGVRYRPMEVSIGEAVQSYLEWGLLPLSPAAVPCSAPGGGQATRVLTREQALQALGEDGVGGVLAERLVSSALAARASPSQEGLSATASYSTPLLPPWNEGGEAGGGCAGAPGLLAPEPFPILTTLSSLPRAPPPKDPLTLHTGLVVLKAICEGLASALKADWVGVYALVHPPPPPAHVEAFGACPSAPNLLKLAYCGAASRAYFPLTEAFAAGSNNSTVGLRGVVVHIPDTAALALDAPYYTCDAKVRSEVCLPIWGAPPGGSARVVGIIDAEAFAPQAFSGAAIATLLRTAQLVASLVIELSGSDCCA